MKKILTVSGIAVAISAVVAASFLAVKKARESSGF